MVGREQKLKDLTSYMQDKGFVYGPSPEIYGGVAGFYDYGPLGKLLKNNVENTIRKIFQGNEFFEVECPTVLPREVWEASGHLSGFSDPIIKDKKGNIYRADKVIEEHFLKTEQMGDGPRVDGAPSEELLRIIKAHKIKAPDGTELIPEIKQHNLMMKTTIGLDREAYNRPETATTTYLPFMRYTNFFREKLPFGVFQIGKAYRNEVSPRQYLLRMREFTQAEAQIFLFKEQKKDFERFEEIKNLVLPLHKHVKGEKWEEQKITFEEAIKKRVLKNKGYAWTLALAYKLFKDIGIQEDKMRLWQHSPDERAFYAEDAWDLEIKTNTFGWVECCGIHDRTDYDLKTHAKHSGEKLIAMNEKGEKEVPHVLEIAFGTDRPVFALLDSYYELKDKEEGKTTLKIPYELAPIQACVFPLSNKLHGKAREVYKEIVKDHITLYDKSGSIGKRYLRADSIGVPYCITIDFETLEDGKVTIRDRNTAKQERVKIEDIRKYIVI